MRKSFHKKIFAYGCIATIISLADVKPLTAKATNTKKPTSTSSISTMAGRGITNEKGLFAPGIKTKSCSKVFWYKCIATEDGKEKVYYRSKKQISTNVNDLFLELKRDGNFFSTEVIDIKEISKIEELFEFEPEPSSEELSEELSEESDDENLYLAANKISKQIKTPEEFKKLSKSEKAEYLADPKSPLSAKMRCHSYGPSLFEYNTSQFHTLLTSRFEDYFKDLFVENSERLKNPLNKELYDEYLEYLCNLCKSIEKFMKDSELCEIYRRIYEILNS